MKIKEFREMTSEELDQKIQELKGQLFNLNRQQAVGQLEHGVDKRNLRKDIAKALTVKREKQLNLAK